MLKKNSQKSLLLLYSSDKNQKLLGESSKVVSVLEDLQPGGKRAMLTWWQNQGWTEPVYVSDRRYLTLTTLGRSVLENEFPYFQVPANWKGEWQILILRQAPTHDRGFHALRQVIKRLGGMPLARGVYAFINRLPLALEQRCISEYGDSILILALNSATTDYLNDIALKHFSLYDQVSLYSGISSELYQLLMKKDVNKGLMYRNKHTINALFDRFFAIFCVDNGLMESLMPGAPKPREMLHQFQQLLLA